MLVLSNLACVDDEAAAAIEAFIANGGAIVASFDAGVLTLDGEARRMGRVRRSHRWSRRAGGARAQIVICEDRKRDDPLLAGIGDTDLIPNEGALVEIDADARPQRSAHTDSAGDRALGSDHQHPGVQRDPRERPIVPVAVRGTHGEGRIVYFCNRSTSCSIATAFPDLGRVLANAVRMGRERAGLEVDAPEYVESTLNGASPAPARAPDQFSGRQTIEYRLAADRAQPRAACEKIAVRLRLDAGEAVREARVATTEKVHRRCVQDGDWA